MLQLKDTSKFLNSDNSIKYEYFLQCFDKIKNAVSIYDKEGVLLFANKAFCRNFAITDINSAIGKKITEIATENGLENTATSSNISKWKMFDVLKNGETIANWEVRLDAQGSSDMPLFISNDMYPIFDDNGQVQGMIEISRYRDQDIKLIKNVAGLDANYSFDDIIGVSPIMKECIKTAKEYALSPYNILITGESGVGKELFSQAIHNYSMRRMRPFVALNCATFPENLIESELFGYVGGAFTGASKNGQIGKFEFIVSVILKCRQQHERLRRHHVEHYHVGFYPLCRKGRCHHGDIPRGHALKRPVVSLRGLDIIEPHVVEHLARIPFFISLKHSVYSSAIVGVNVLRPACAGPVKLGGMADYGTRRHVLVVQPNLRYGLKLFFCFYPFKSYRRIMQSE